MQHIIRRTAVAILLLIVATGCGAHRLKQAQDSYNEAARIEAQVSFQEVEPAGDPLEGDVQALRNYRVALALTDEALEKYEKSLVKDQLYGTALMLKALCEWRVAALDQDADAETVRKLVNEIEIHVEEKKIVLGTRDKVLLKALPGLREHALGLHAEPEKAKRLFKSSLATLDNALSDVQPPEDHPVRAYIHLAQLRTLRAWRWIEYPDRPEDAVELKKWFEDWNKRYEEYRDKLVPLVRANPGLKAYVEKIDKDFGYKSM
jgi:hypothetical protein